jgi:O-antigen ligase
VILDSGQAPSRARASVAKLSALLGGALYLFIAFVVVLREQNGMRPDFIAATVVATLPLCLFFAIRFPLIFPFGLYVLLVPFDSLLQVSGGATIVRIIAGATAATMILHTIILRRAFPMRRPWFAWLAMILYIAASLLWTSDLQGGSQVTVAALQLFLFMTVLAAYPATRAEFKLALGIVVVCGALSGCYAIHQYLTGNVTNESAYRVELTAGKGVLLDYNYYGGSFVLPIALALYFAFYGRAAWSRYASGGSALLMLVGLLLTGSRGAFIAAVAILLYFALRSRHKVKVFGFIALAGIVSAFFPSVYIRFANDPSNQQGSGSGRTFIWETGLHSLRDHWLFGSGIGSYENTYDRNFLDVYQAAFQGWSRPSHSLIVGSLSELGVVGLVLVLSAWFVSFRELRKVSATSEWFGLRLAFEGTIVALFALALTIDPTYVKYIWLAQSLSLMFLNQALPAGEDRAVRLRRRTTFVTQLARGRPARAK